MGYIVYCNPASVVVSHLESSREIVLRFDMFVVNSRAPFTNMV